MNEQVNIILEVNFSREEESTGFSKKTRFFGESLPLFDAHLRGFDGGMVQGALKQALDKIINFGKM
jgi:hypothetical protein